MDQKRSLKLYNRRAPIYNFTHHLQTLWADGFHRKELAKTAQLQENMIVLDIGCGTGLLSLELLKQYRNILVIGIDYSPKMLHQFRKTVVKRGIESNIRIIQANAECLPLKSGSLDAVLSIYGLGGIPHLDSAMSEIKRVISKNGIVCFGEMVSPPDSSNVISRKIHQKIVEPLIKFFWEFRDIKLPELLLKYGFEIKEKKYYKNRILGSTLIIKAKP